MLITLANIKMKDYYGVFRVRSNNMTLKKHPNYKEELERLKYTIEYVEKAIASAKDRKENLRSDMQEAYVELNNRDDSSSSYSRIMLDARFLDNLAKNYDGLIRAHKKPYFSRIDFQHKETLQPLKYYIGKAALTRVEDNEPIIIDWRSPIASVYYDGMLGEVSYATPTGIAEGELHLKRQYTIRNGELEDILDVDITTTDSFLQAALGENKDDKLKDIVSTIQSEQNEIIRADIDYPLIVQGAAGSGKTTIALHRIAYLIYTYEKNFDPESFLIIAPNRLFLKYISEVLPELGVERVKQTTFIDFAYDLLGISYKLINPDEKLIRFIKAEKEDNEGEASLLRDVSQFKGSLEFRNTIDRYVNSLEQAFAPEEDFCFGGHILCTSVEIKKMILSDLSKYPLYKRVAEVRKTLSRRLKRDKVQIIKAVEARYDKQIDNLFKHEEPSEERRSKIIALVNERDQRLKSLKNAAKTVIANYIALFPKRGVMDYYRELTTSLDKMRYFGGSFENNDMITYFCNSTEEILNMKNIELEDLTALMYLQFKLFGFNKKIDIKYCVIDEAQDFSLFQIYTLKKVFNTELFTLLGDLAQGIHSYRGIHDWKDILENVFTNSSSRFLTLEQSYRTTVEIMSLANEVLKLSRIPGLVLARPVVRHGDKPGIYRCNTEKDFIDTLESRIGALKSKQYKTTAMICKTLDECEKVKSLLDKRQNFETKLLSSEDINYTGGTVIVPSYMAKGLEFDAVIVTCLEEDYGAKELDIKLLYVAMTRALHSLDVIACETTMTLLDKIV
jgi:DNA helicase-2/ATP-dependent DNA helicase PcrA